MQALLPLAVGIQLFGEGADFLFLGVAGSGEGEWFEAAGFRIVRNPFYLDSESGFDWTLNPVSTGQ